jgi:cell division protein FtsB
MNVTGSTTEKKYEELPAQNESIEKRVKLLKLYFAEKVARQKTLVATELPLDTWYQIRVSTKLAYPLPSEC